jgi:hypothetical protein
MLVVSDTMADGAYPAIDSDPADGPMFVLSAEDTLMVGAVPERMILPAGTVTKLACFGCGDDPAIDSCPTAAVISVVPGTTRDGAMPATTRDPVVPTIPKAFLGAMFERANAPETGAIPRSSRGATPARDIDPAAGVMLNADRTVGAMPARDNEPADGVIFVVPGTTRAGAIPAIDILPVPGATRTSVRNPGTMPDSDIEPAEPMAVLSFRGAIPDRESTPTAGVTRESDLPADAIPARDRSPVAGVIFVVLGTTTDGAIPVIPTAPTGTMTPRSFLGAVPAIETAPAGIFTPREFAEAIPVRDIDPASVMTDRLFRGAIPSTARDPADGVIVMA